MRCQLYLRYRYCNHNCCRTPSTRARPSIDLTCLSRKYTHRFTPQHAAHRHSSDGSRSTLFQFLAPRTRKRPLSLRTYHETTHRLQHTQSAPVLDIFDEDTTSQTVEREPVVVEEKQNEETITQQDADGSGTNITKLDLIRLLTQTVTKCSDQLLHVVGRYLPRAVPIVSISNTTEEDWGNDAEDPRYAYHVKFVNDEYSISISDNVKLLRQSDMSFDAALEGLARKYSDCLARRLETSDAVNDTVRPFPIQTIRDMLKIDRIELEFKRTDPLMFDKARLGLYLFQAHTGQIPLGKEQIWCDAGTAQRLARLSADATILQRAEEEGIDWDAIKSYLTTNDRPSKQNDKIDELLHVTSREEPRTYHVSISDETLSTMIYTLRKVREYGLPDNTPLQPLKREPRLRLTKHDRQGMKEISEQLKATEMEKPLSPEMKRMRSKRDELPIRVPSTAKQILQTIRKYDVTVLVSETGSGKTTQLPQLLLEQAILSGKGATCNIICTQPRRIAAISVAARVAKERGVQVGESVGYRVRFDSRPSVSMGSIDYVTAGVLLKMLQDGSEDLFRRTSHIIVDEIHERSLPTDILLSLLRDLMTRRRSDGLFFPKIILMSATMKSSDFEQYFAQQHEHFTPRVASISIPGRAFPVTSYMLEDIIPILVNEDASKKVMTDLVRESKQYIKYEDDFIAEVESHLLDSTDVMPNNDTRPVITKDPAQDAIIPYGLIAATVSHICNTFLDGDILVFLPGMGEIDTVTNILESRLAVVKNPKKVRLFKLHAAFHSTNTKVFEPIPDDCRRIILATNIAQTSLTLPGVVHVIDSGKQREMSYDQILRRSTFDCVWIDQATSVQRKGRAGRVQKGFYWAMFTQTRFDAMPERSRSEILASDLTTTSLVLKSHSDTIDLHNFFAHTLDAPDRKTVSACIQELQELGMLTADQKITALGQFCSDFPLHPAKAKGLLLGLLFRCFRPLMIVACHDTENPLIHSASDRAEIYHANLTFAGVTDDDRYAFIRAFQLYDAACENGQSIDIKSLQDKHVKHNVYKNMLNVARQIYEIMSRYDFFCDQDVLSLNDTSNVFRLLDGSRDVDAHRVNLFKALALSVVNTNLAVWDEEQASWLAKDIKCMLKPYGVNTKLSLKLTHRGMLRRTGEVVGYSEMLKNIIRSTRPFLVENSTVTPLMAILFGGPIRLLSDDTIEIDGWLRYKIRVVSAAGKRLPSWMEDQSTAATILEFKKALDRFITLAFQDLRKFPPRSKQEKREGISNIYFKSGEIADTMQRGLGDILDSDAAHWDTVLEKT